MNQSGSLKILIAEQEPDIQKVYDRYLSSLGLHVALTDNAKECINELFSNSVYDMVIIDTHRDDDSWIQAVEQIRKRKPDQSIILTTTYSIDDVVSKAYAIGIRSENILLKPFTLDKLLSVIRPKIKRLQKVELTDHIIAAYKDLEDEIGEAIPFLKLGLDNNEAIVLIHRSSIDSGYIKERMRSAGIDADRLLANGSLVIKTDKEWFMPDGKVEIQRIVNQWTDLINAQVKKGKKGVRAFTQTSCFFDDGLGDKIVEIEHSLPAKFAIPFLPICAYRQKDIESMSKDNIRKLTMCHNHVWIG